MKVNLNAAPAWATHLIESNYGCWWFVSFKEGRWTHHNYTERGFSKIECEYVGMEEFADAGDVNGFKTFMEDYEEGKDLGRFKEYSLIVDLTNK